MKKTSNRLHSLFAALAALILAAALAVPAFAVEGGFADLYYRMFDDAEVLTEDEDNELDEYRQKIKALELSEDTEKKLLKEVSLFDVYEGKNLEAGKKSYAVSFLLQDENATLNDKQIDKIMSKLVKNLEDKLNAKLR